MLQTIVLAAELIDTLWNVNTLEVSYLLYTRIELIDTLWNVNKMKKIQVIADYLN